LRNTLNDFCSVTDNLTGDEFDQTKGAKTLRFRNHFFPFLLGALVILAASTARAQESASTSGQNISPAKQALIKELLELANSQKTVDAIIKAQSDQMEKQLPEIVWQSVSGMKELKALSPAEREELHREVLASASEIGRKTYDLLLAKIDFGKTIEEISLGLYDKYFSEEELRDLVAFNKSATGRKVVEKMPQLYSESMARASDIIGPKILEVIRELQDQQTAALTTQIQAKVKAKPAKTPITTPSKRRSG
jgi:hypothetical protein